MVVYMAHLQNTSNLNCKLKFTNDELNTNPFTKIQLRTNSKNLQTKQAPFTNRTPHYTLSIVCSAGKSHALCTVSRAVSFSIACGLAGHILHCSCILDFCPPLGCSARSGRCEIAAGYLANFQNAGPLAVWRPLRHYNDPVPRVVPTSLRYVLSSTSVEWSGSS